MLSAAQPVPRIPRWWWLAAVLAASIAMYSLRYVVIGERAYTPELATSFRERPIAVLLHTLFGPVALVLGMFNLIPAFQPPWRRSVHRTFGRIYVVAAMMLASAGLLLSPHAAGGIVARSGFFALALATLGASAVGFLHIRRGDVGAHREWMTRSYACIFGAVTLRLWMPLLMALNGGEFLPAYRVVAWLAWLPNLAFAEWTIRRGRAGRIDPALASATEDLRSDPSFRR